MFVFRCYGGCDYLYTATVEIERRTANGPLCPRCGSGDRLWLCGREKREELDGRDPTMLPRASADPALRGLPNNRRTLGVIATQMRRLYRLTFDGVVSCSFEEEARLLEGLRGDQRYLLASWGLTPTEWNELLNSRLDESWIRRGSNEYRAWPEDAVKGRVYADG